MDVPMLWPPSIPTKLPITPSLCAFSSSLLLVTILIFFEYLEVSLRITSICSRVSCTASRNCASHGTYTDQNCPPTIPCRNRTRSVCHWDPQLTFRDKFSSKGKSFNFVLPRCFRRFHAKSLCLKHSFTNYRIWINVFFFFYIISYPSIKGISESIRRTTWSLASNKCELRSSKAKGNPTPATRAHPRKKKPIITIHFLNTLRPAYHSIHTPSFYVVI